MTFPTDGEQFPLLGEFRVLQCPDGHVAAEWWCVPDEPEVVGDPTTLTEGDACETCGKSLIFVIEMRD